MSGVKPVLDEMKLSEVVFDEVVYPRKDHDPALVQRYAQVIDEIEAKQAFIAVASDNKLLDGKHRWLAYRTANEGEDPTIKVLRYNVSAPHDQLKLAARLNSQHGWQLTAEDKQATSIALHSYGCTYRDIADTLSVGLTAVTEWLSNTVKAEKKARDEKIRDLWMSCHTQEEIAEAVDIDRTVVSDQTSGFVDLILEEQNHKTDASHTDADFKVPIYNVWTSSKKTNKVELFGNTELRWLDNLLYAYTEPFEIVVDPFAGGGSTIDICKKRWRRYWVSDRKPIVARESEIRQHDITEGLPGLHRWSDVGLVYLDPPYWKQAEGKYSEDPKDLANMELEEFNAELSKLIKAFAAKLKKAKSDAYIALIIQPTQYNAPEHQFTDHVGDMLRSIKLPVENRISAPYSTEQYTPQVVEWAKENREFLVLTREIVVWRVQP